MHFCETGDGILLLLSEMVVLGYNWIILNEYGIKKVLQIDWNIYRVLKVDYFVIHIEYIFSLEKKYYK